jgi:Rrf2 family nitric oxide-sensitive transcriptional repressor
MKLTKYTDYALRVLMHLAIQEDRTEKGKGGGIFLCKAPSTISVGQVVRRLEATLDPINCDEPVCCIKEACLLKPALLEAMQAFLAILDKYTLADITQNDQCLVKLLHSGGTEDFFK